MKHRSPTSQKTLRSLIFGYGIAALLAVPYANACFCRPHATQDAFNAGTAYMARKTKQGPQIDPQGFAGLERQTTVRHYR